MGLLLGALLQFLVQFFTKAFVNTAFKIAIATLFITTMIAMLYAYFVAGQVIISSLAQTVPDVVTGVWGWVMPANTSACLLALGAAVILRFVTAQAIAILRSKLLASISN